MGNLTNVSIVEVEIAITDAACAEREIVEKPVMRKKGYY